MHKYCSSSFSFFLQRSHFLKRRACFAYFHLRRIAIATSNKFEKDGQALPEPARPSIFPVSSALTYYCQKKNINFADRLWPHWTSIHNRYKAEPTVIFFMKAIHAWLDVATSDLAAAETLLTGRHLPQAVYQFQQSVEKANKALGLFSGITADVLKNQIGHKSHKLHVRVIAPARSIFTAATELAKTYPSLNEICLVSNKNIPSLAKEMEAFADFIDKVEREPDLVTRETSQSLLAGITTVNQVFNATDMIDIEANIGPALERMKDTSTLLTRVLQPIWKDHPQVRIDSEEVMNDFANDRDRIVKAIIGSCKYFYASYLGCAFLAVLTSGPIGALRYPGNVPEASPLELYTENTPIVQVLPELIALQRRVLQGLRETLTFLSTLKTPEELVH